MAVSTINVMTVADLKMQPVSTDTILLLVGKEHLADGLGGFYRWDVSSTLDEDMAFLNVIKSSVSSTGRWVRIFQRVRQFSHGVLVSVGGVKTFYVLGKATDANGLVTAYLTDDGTPTGNALFSSVWTAQGQAIANAGSANDLVVGGQKSLSSDMKTLVYQFARGGSVTLGASLTALLGLVIPGLRPPGTGTPVTLIVTGL